MDVLSDLIREFDDGGDSAAVARKVASAAVGRHPEAVEEMLAEMISWRIASLRRNAVRRREDEAFGQEDSPTVAARPPDSPLGPVSQVSKLRIFVPDNSRGGGAYVPYGQMTAEMHDARAVRVEQRAAALAADAERHRWAARTIREHGVRCLDDLL